MENKEKLVEFNNKLIELCREYNVRLAPDLTIKIVPLKNEKENKGTESKGDSEVK